MQRYFAALILALLLVQPITAQPMGDTLEAMNSRSPAYYDVRNTIETMFDGMRARDTSAVRAVFHPNAQMSTTGSRNGSAFIAPFSSPDRFISSLGSATGPTWDERIWDVEIIIDDNLATAIVPYAFILGDQLSHCGTNMFQLFQEAPGSWKVTFITDTRRRDCSYITPEQLEETAVRVALRNYLDGHATGDGTFHEQAFHPEAMLYWVTDGSLSERTSEAYIAGAPGRPAADEAERNRYVEWVDIAGDAAVAKVILDYPSVKFVDYMTLLKVDGRWQIINKAFQRTQPDG